MTDTPTRPANDVTSDGRDYPLELDTAAMRGLVEATMERIVAHISSLPRQSLSNTRGGMELARSLAEPLPEAGTPAAELLDLLFDHAAIRPFVMDPYQLHLDADYERVGSLTELAELVGN